MKRSRFSEERIIGVLKEHEAGAAVADLCRKHGMSSATFYAWKARFGGLEGEADQAAFQWKDAPPNDAKKLKAL